MRVLVLGACGVIGSALVSQLTSGGHDVVEWDLQISSEHDLSCEDTLPLLRSRIEESDFVFFLAYDVGGSKFLSRPTLEFMNRNSRIMMNTFPLLASKRFIFASSTMSNMDIAYGALKMVGEHYTRVTGGVVARFWNVYGFQKFGEKSYALTDFMHSFITTGKVRLLSNGCEKRQFLHSRDCAKCLEVMMLHYDDMKPIVDVTSFKWTTIFDAAKLICSDVTRGDKLGDSHSFNNEPDSFILKFWKPSIALEEGIEEVLNEMQADSDKRRRKDLPARRQPNAINAFCTSSSRQIRKVKAPSRIDLAGGWTDVPVVAHKLGGEVVAFALTLHAHAEFAQDAYGNLQGLYRSTTPIGSGLGTTGAVNVALMGAIDGLRSTKEQIAERAFCFETLAGNYGGRQDQYMAALGGFRHLKFDGEMVTHQQIHVSAVFGQWFKNNLLLFDSKIAHSSGDIHREIWAKFEAEDIHVVQGMHVLKKAAQRMASALHAEDERSVVDSMSMVCVGVDLIDIRLHEPFKALLEPLVQSGDVRSWKAAGAGAGGCVIVLVNQNSLKSVETKLQSSGWKKILWDFDEDGLVATEKSLLSDSFR